MIGMIIGMILAGVLAYLLGSVSFGVLISKLAHKDDIRRHGSGNAGMTNALRVYGGKTAIWVFAGDFLKGGLAVWLGLLLGGGYGQMAAALLVVVGHLFPVFFGFRGGKGVATAAGAILALSPLTLVILVVPFGLILLFTRYMSLAAITVAVLYPLIMLMRLYLYGGAWEQWCMLATATAMGGLVVFMHRSNIARLRNGTESKVGQKAD